MHFPQPSARARFQRVEKRVRKELKQSIAGPIRYAQRATGQPPPRDDRSRWHRFVESSELVGVEHRLHLEVPLDSGRTLWLTLDIGPAPRGSYPVCLGLELRASTVLHLPALILNRPRLRFEGGNETLNAALQRDRDLLRQLRGLLKHGYHAGAMAIGGRAAFLATSHLADGQPVLLVSTMPQEIWGGFVLRLGLAEFLELVDRVEQRATEVLGAEAIAPDRSADALEPELRGKLGALFQQVFDS
jgi:hypothetical protein